MVKKYIVVVILLMLVVLCILCIQVRDIVAQNSSEATYYQSIPAGDAGNTTNCPTKTDYMPEGTGHAQLEIDIEPLEWLSLVSDMPQQRSQRSGIQRGGEQRGGEQRGGERRGSEQYRRRPWSELISTEELLKFLEEHESRLGAKLKTLHEEDPEKFSDLPLVVAMKELYGPVIQQMHRDPEGGKLSLKKIQLRLRIQRSVYDVKRSTEQSSRHDEARKDLTGHVSELFDVVIAQEEASLRRMEEWLKIRLESDPEQQRTGERTGGRRGGQRVDPRQRGGSSERLQGELAAKKKAIPAWKENKDKIVEERVEELLQDHPNFPWGD